MAQKYVFQRLSPMWFERASASPAFCGNEEAWRVELSGLVIAYGIMRNGSRTRANKQVTEQATKNLYAKEERDRVRSGAE